MGYEDCVVDEYVLNAGLDKGLIWSGDGNGDGGVAGEVNGE